MRGVLLGQDTGKGEQRLPREAATGNLVSIDPPGHSELRRIVSRGFTPRTMQAWRPRIDELVEEMLGATHGDRLDVVASLASPLPVRVIAELRSEEHTSELQSLMRISYAVFCLKK